MSQGTELDRGRAPLSDEARRAEYRQYMQAASQAERWAASLCPCCEPRAIDRNYAEAAAMRAKAREILGELEP